MALRIEAVVILSGIPTLVARVIAAAVMLTGAGVGVGTGLGVGVGVGVDCEAFPLFCAVEVKFSAEQLHNNISEATEKVVHNSFIFI